MSPLLRITCPQKDIRIGKINGRPGIEVLCGTPCCRDADIFACGYENKVLTSGEKHAIAYTDVSRKK